MVRIRIKNVAWLKIKDKPGIFKVTIQKAQLLNFSFFYSET